MDIHSTKWATNLVNLAREVSTWSKDDSTKVGAIIVAGDGRPLSWGYNGFPYNIDDTVVERNQRPLKYQYVCHAERNAMDLSQGDLRSSTMIVTMSPCSECAKSIIQRGITHVMVDSSGSIDNVPERWVADLIIGRDMLLEAGVKYKVVDMDS